VIGIVAGRIKERHHRPVFAFAPGDEDLLKGSGRSVPGLHLRDALDWISKKHPGLLLRFGGHAMAAGVTLRAADLARFEQAFEEAAQTIGTEALGVAELPTDGSLPLESLTLATVGRIEHEVWGQGFPAPLFLDAFTVTEQRQGVSNVWRHTAALFDHRIDQKRKADVLKLVGDQLIAEFPGNVIR